MMDFVFDVAELAPGTGKSVGIYNYARNLCRHMVPRLARLGMRMHITCNTGSAPDFRFDGEPSVVQHVVIDSPQPGTLARQAWMRWRAGRFCREVGASCYFSPKGFLPGSWGGVRGLRTVVVLHDLIPLWYEDHVPGHFGRLESWVVNQGLLRTARHADDLIVISRATADDVARRVGRATDDMHIVYNGVPHVGASERHPLGRPYLFAVASALPHKNLSTLLQAYRLYRARSPEPLPLVVCGVSDIAQEGVMGIKGVDDEVLHTYYAHAELFLFFPLIEGFGFPPVEAMLHGTPVLCSDIAALREVTCGEAALVDPMSPERISEEIERLLRQRPDAGALARARDRVLSRYNWDRCADEVLAVLAQGK